MNQTYFDVIPEELIILVFLKSDNYYNLIENLQLNENKYFRYLCIDKFKGIPFSRYPINLSLTSRQISYMRIYESINYIIIDKNIKNNITERELYMYCDTRSEVFLWLLWDFNDLYVKYMTNPNGSNKILEFEYINLLKMRINYFKKYSPLYLSEVLNNFKAYIPIYINNKIIEHKLIPYGNDYIDPDGFITKKYTEESDSLFLCTHKLVNGQETAISGKDNIVVYNKGYSRPPIIMRR
jgi:hypothetical protein